MAIINLRKYYYPTYKKDTFIEVSDEVAEALLLMLRAENNYAQKRLYHKAYFSLDCEDGIENDSRKCSNRSSCAACSSHSIM